MSLPNQLDDDAPTGSDSPALGDNELRALKTFLRDMLTLPNATNISAAIANFAAAGCQYVILQNAAADAADAGRLQRNGATLTFHDGNARRGVAVVMNKSATEVTVQNTVTETSLWSFAVPANTLNAVTTGTNGMLRATVLARVTNGSGLARNLTVRGKLGASTFATITVSIADATTGDVLRPLCFVFPDGASDNLRGQMTLFREGVVAPGDEGSAGTNAAQQTMDVTVEWAFASANCSVVKSAAVLEWLP